MNKERWWIFSAALQPKYILKLHILNYIYRIMKQISRLVLLAVKGFGYTVNFGGEA